MTTPVADEGPPAGRSGVVSFPHARRLRTVRLPQGQHVRSAPQPVSLPIPIDGRARNDENGGTVNPVRQRPGRGCRLSSDETCPVLGGPGPPRNVRSGGFGGGTNSGGRQKPDTLLQTPIGHRTIQRAAGPSESPPHHRRRLAAGPDPQSGVRPFVGSGRVTPIGHRSRGLSPLTGRRE